MKNVQDWKKGGKGEKGDISSFDVPVNWMANLQWRDLLDRSEQKGGGKQKLRGAIHFCLSKSISVIPTLRAFKFSPGEI